MDRGNPTFTFLSDSEESDSSSSSEKKRKSALLQKQVLTDSVKPSEIIINENELEALIKRIEVITFLNHSHLKSPIFDDSVRSKAQLFLTTYTHEKLFTYYSENKIFADFVVPKCSSNTMYFIKLLPSNENDTSMDFLKSIIFGNLDENVNETLIPILKMIYLCAFYTVKSLPYRIKRRMTKNGEDFLSQLSEDFYRNFGISEIYLPALSFFDPAQINQMVRSADLINSLEGIILRWCHLITEAIQDNEIDFYTVKDFNISTQLNFWHYRLHNLKQISKYLRNEKSIKLYEILQEHNNVHLKHLFQLQTKLDDEINECRSVIRYLKFLKQIHEKLNSSKIANIPTILPELFQTVNMIVTQSTYFEKRKNTNLLITSVSKQIINSCKTEINVKDILNGRTTEPMENLIETVKTCYVYSQSLKNGTVIMSLNNESSPPYGCIEIFMQRCNDLLELCSTINIFFCSQKNGHSIQITIDQQIGVEENLIHIHNQFLSNLNHLKQIEDRILYVQCTNWCIAAKIFQNQLQEVENEIEKFAETAFTYVTTIEDGLNILRITYHFSKLKSLRPFFMQKNDLLMNKILRETKEIKEHTFLQITKSLIGNSPDLILVTTAFLKKRRLQFLLKLIDDSGWLVGCELLREVKLDIDECVVNEDQFMMEKYKQWLERLDPSILNQLKRPLVTKCFYKSDLLEVNINRKFLKTVQESRAWTQIGFKLPQFLDKTAITFARILILYGNVEELVLNYNRIISSLSGGEYILFSELINLCSETISPTLYTMQWDYDQHNDTVLNYLKHVKFVENMVNKYKYYNKQIIETCKIICSINFLHIVRNDIDDLKEEVYTNRLICLKKIMNHYNVIASSVQTIFSSFGYHIHKMKEIWNLYIEKIDVMLESALLCCAKNSLTTLLHNCSSTSDLDNDSLIKITIKATIRNGKIQFQPDLNEILTFFSHVDSITLEGLKVIPRLYNKFKIFKGNKKISYAKKLTTNDDVSQLQDQITSVILENLAYVRERIKLWNQYRSLWKISANEYAQQYSRICDSALNYETDFSMYFYLTRKIRDSNHIEQIFLFILNTEEIADEVVSQCANRLDHLSQALRKTVNNLLENVRLYVEESELKLYQDALANEYLTCVKTLITERYEKEKEIQRIHDYIYTLGQFKFQENLEMKLQEMMENWRKHTNTLERCELKIKIMRNIKI